jgi:hypothetical protein
VHARSTAARLIEPGLLTFRLAAWSRTHRTKQDLARRIRLSKPSRARLRTLLGRRAHGPGFESGRFLPSSLAIQAQPGVSSRADRSSRWRCRRPGLRS